MKALLAEALGTFILVFAGTGAIVVNDVSGGSVTHLGVSLTFGLAVMLLIHALSDVSGAHLNPAVTLGLMAAGRFRARQAVPYLLAQCAGAIAASGALRLLFPTHATLGATLPAGTPLHSFLLEIVLAWLLMFVILLVNRRDAAIAVGAVITLEALFAGPVSGASMNPTRSLAPALVSGHLEHLGIYLVAPPLGALLGVWTWKGVRNA